MDYLVSKLLFLFLLMFLSKMSKGSVIKETMTASEYLGQFTYFQSWHNRRRILVLKGRNRAIQRELELAKSNFSCQLAARNVNIVLLGDDGLASETTFSLATSSALSPTPSSSSTSPLPPRLASRLSVRLEQLLHRDLRLFSQYALLLGYDGGRKRMYRRFNLDAVLDKIDAEAIFQRERNLLKQKGITCDQNGEI